MRKNFGFISLMVGGFLALAAFANQANASPLEGMLSPGLQSYVGSNVEPVHCRRYRHCHRRCWSGRYGWHCRRFCHRCG